MEEARWPGQRSGGDGGVGGGGGGEGELELELGDQAA